MAAIESTKAVAGLVKKIRESEETQEWDLAGYSESQVNGLVQGAFKDIVRLSEMIRHTFVVGGGKKVRQKYDDKLPKFFTAALREVGFEEDRAAVTEVSCSATFKQQHDTDKDLKFLHVYPKVEIKGGGGGGAEEEDGGSDLTTLGSPGYLAAVCAQATFQKMVASKTQSWSQRRRLLAELKDFGSRFVAMDQKMMSGQPLTEEEQDLYDVSSAEGIGEKCAWLEKQLKGMVDQGNLTAGEKQQLLAQVQERIGGLEAEAAAAVAEGKPKKAEKLNAQLDAARARHAKVIGVEPVRHPLKHEDAIKALRVKIVPLLALEGTSGLRTMAEMKAIGTRPDMEVEVERLEGESRGWFEEDAEFAARCALVAAAAKAKASRKTTAEKKAAKGKAARPEDAWETTSGASEGGWKTRR